MPGLEDPNFARSITYICDHSADGAMGIVLTQPLNLSRQDVFKQLDLPCNPQAHKQLVLCGGPVQQQRGFILHNSGPRYAATLPINDAVSLSSSLDILAAIADGQGPQQTLLALGYAGWGAGQLEQELADNAWLTLSADSHSLFETPTEERWDEITQRLGIDINLIPSNAGHA